MHNKTSNHFLQHAVHLQREKKFLTGIFYCSLLPSKRPTLPPQKLRRSSVSPSGAKRLLRQGLLWAILGIVVPLRTLASSCGKNKGNAIVFLQQK